MRREPGFTLIEIMIVIAIIAIIALLAIPNLLGGRLVANETSTVGTLRSIASAQAQFQARQIVDQDSDGLGEYGFLQELAGATIPRGRANPLLPPSISQTLGYVDAAGIVTKTGYAYIMFLPSGAGAPVQEPAAGVVPGGNPVDANFQEISWCCYAIPTVLRNTGNRAFVCSQQSEVYATANVGVQDYDIANIAALLGNPNAAFEAGVTNLAGKFAVGVGAAQDGGTWVPAS
ncbi:MAG: prepilin-type N-terminal cleavage/methylation domain-containing protein [Planctomycetota bacterium]|jgi:prepilin-type N-terminal cleavage/methylation domain-containing protein